MRSKSLSPGPRQIVNRSGSLAKIQISSQPGRGMPGAPSQALARPGSSIRLQWVRLGWNPNMAATCIPQPRPEGSRLHLHMLELILSLHRGWGWPFRGVLCLAFHVGTACMTRRRDASTIFRRRGELGGLMSRQGADGCHVASCHKLIVDVVVGKAHHITTLHRSPPRVSTPLLPDTHRLARAGPRTLGLPDHVLGMPLACASAGKLKLTGLWHAPFPRRPRREGEP